MKLASLKEGRDGLLVVVSDDLAWCTEARAVAPTLQAALDNWTSVEPELRALYALLNDNAIERQRFNEDQASSPLPRAFQWADGSAYVNHVALVRQARNAEMPHTFWTDPLMYQGGSDSFLGPRDLIPLADPAWGCDFEAEVAVIVDDVPMGVDALAARDHIKLSMLVNDVSLRNLIPGELAKGFGFFQSKPPSAFSPVAVAPEALVPAWSDARLDLRVDVTLNGASFGATNASDDMTFDFGQLIAHAAKTRPLCAGTIIGSGTVSNRGADGGPGKPIAEGGRGYSCIAEQRMVETILEGRPQTPFLQAGDIVRIECVGSNGRSIFGAIEQRVVAIGAPRA